MNRAPLLTLWVAVVATRKGYQWDTALTFGKSITTRFAKTKGESLGIDTGAETTTPAAQQRRKVRIDQTIILEQSIPVMWTKQGLRACDDVGHEYLPDPSAKYIQHAFGANLDRVKATLEDLAQSFPDASTLDKLAYQLYTRFRPATSGWGAKGKLSLNAIRSLHYVPPSVPETN